MMADTHLEGGALAWLAVCAVAHPAPDVIVLGLGLSLAGALAVDVDHERADAAQFARLAGLAVLAAAIVAGVQAAQAHRGTGTWVALATGGFVLGLLPWLTRPHGGGFRGVVHSKWGLGSAFLASFVPCLWGWPAWAGAASMTGWLSHLALDALTKEGLRLNWPDQSRWGWLPRSQSMATGGPRPRRKGSRRRGRGRKVGLEYKLVQPVLAGCIVGAGALIVLGGGHP